MRLRQSGYYISTRKDSLKEIWYIYLHELTDELAVKASCVDDWSGVVPENPRAGVLN